MTLVKFNPWTPARRFNTLMDDFFGDGFFDQNVKGPGTGLWNPAVDIYEKDGTIVINADLPGVKKEDITIDLEGNVLTLKAKKNEDKEIKKEQFYKRERVSGSFQRAFTLPDHVNPETVNAEFKDGVLKIQVAKPEDQKAKQITVN